MSLLQIYQWVCQKEFWKSVNIWGSYGQEFVVFVFLRHSVCRVARVWYWWWRQWTIDLSAVFVLGMMELVGCGFRLVVLDAGQVCECDSPSALLGDTNTRFYAMARDAGIVAWPTRSTRITESVAGTHVSYCVERWGVGVVICLERGAYCLHMVQLMPLHPKTPSSLAS